MQKVFIANGFVQKLNEIEIIPLLMGSVGLEVVTRKSWDAQDLDIHVPGDKRGWKVTPESSISKWDKIMKMMNSLYRLIDLLSFLKKVYSQLNMVLLILYQIFAGVQLEDLELHQKGEVKNYLLNLEQYLYVYKSSLKDSYRADKNNNKDIFKINFLKSMMKKD